MTRRTPPLDAVISLEARPGRGRGAAARGPTSPTSIAPTSRGGGR